MDGFDLSYGDVTHVDLLWHIITTCNGNHNQHQSGLTAAKNGSWWSKLGAPQYGGAITIRLNRNVVSFDPYNSEALCNIESAWMERLFTDDWTVDPATFSYPINFRPSDYLKGDLMTNWEFPDPSTFVAHLRQGIHWQNIAPVNGREFTADDVAYHFDRLYGIGNGYTTPSAALSTNPIASEIVSVTATDKYTDVFKWKIPNPEFVMEEMTAVPTSAPDIEAPEAVQAWGNLNDWHHAIGTGPFILQNFVDGSEADLVKNPDYWGYDERYPQNKLPYIDKLNILIIPDNATAQAGLRTGKIDVLDGLLPVDAKSMQKTNPELLEIAIPAQNTPTIDPRNDVKPFDDIRVREALQMAIDLPTLAKTYYNGTVSANPSTITSYYETGWGFPYAQWPQDLKNQYAYNPTQAKQLLAAAGYPNGFTTDIVADQAGDMDLLQIVKSYFADIGVNMSIQTMDSASFVAYVQTNHKQDQMSQKSIGSLGVGFEPVRQFSRFQTGYSGNLAMVNDPVWNAFYTQAMASTTTDQMKQILTQADQYAAQQHFVISLLQPMTYAFYQPWLKGYNGQDDAISGAIVPRLLFSIRPDTG